MEQRTLVRQLRRSMKNQYFGDINDYRKYGLLRTLTGGQIKTAVCWMPPRDAAPKPLV